MVADVVAEWVDELAMENARAVSRTVINFRAWNASHAGVYVREDQLTPPNPSLPENLRSIETSDGKRLVLVNPAYMTRQVGAISAQVDGPIIRITSLKPVRPENYPLPWERQVLEAFEKKQLKEHGQFASPEGKPTFRYAAPLLTKSSCLACHAEQGYKVGDVRGAVTVSLPAAKILATKQSNRAATYAIGTLIWFLGVAIIFLLQRIARARRRQVEKLREMSLMDTLTTLHNRRGFMIRCEQALRTLSREKGTAVLAFADLDRLKEMNDTYGHQEGDAALAHIGKALGSAFRGSDVIARIGGDEFALLLVDAAWEHNEVIKKRIENTVERANQTWTGALPLELSVGLIPVEFTSSSEVPKVDRLLSLADEKMYETKKFRRSARTT